MALVLTLKDLRRKEALGELTPPNATTLALTLALLESIPTWSKESHDDRFAEARRLAAELDQNREIAIDDGTAPEGQPNLELYAGATELERAQSYLEATRAGFSALSEGAKRTQAQALLDEIDAAESTENGVEDEVDEQGIPLRAPHVQAFKNLERRSASFRSLSHDQKCYDDRVRREADRIAESRRATAEAEKVARLERAKRHLADNIPHAPASVQPGRVSLPSLAELRSRWPGNSDVQRAMAWARAQQGDAFDLLPLEQRVRVGADIVRSIKSGMSEDELVAAGAY